MRGPGLLVTGAALATPAGLVSPGWLATRGARIDGLGEGDPPPAATDDREELDARGLLALPGVVDVHVHGAVGHEAMDADVAGLEAMAAFYARHGVTGFLATTWAAPVGDTLAALQAVAAAQRESWSGARLLGAHMEGPYLNPRRCGAQDRATLRRPDPDEAERFLATGVVRLLTLAPELPGGLQLVRACAAGGVTASVGHSDATFAQVRAAVDAGVTHATHLFNAMRPLHHREPGTAGAALALPQVTVELIADEVHLHPAAVGLAIAAKGVDRVALVTDAVRATGMPAGAYSVGPRTVEVGDGAVRLADGSLAGSLLTMDAALRHTVAATGTPAAGLWPATSRSPARAAGVAGRTGSLAAGMDADVVLLDADLQVACTVVQGRVVHRSDLAGSERTERSEGTR